MYSWDEAKNARNRHKHGVSFEVACLVFDDPRHLSRLDRIEGGEERWQTIGQVGGAALLLVAHTWSDDEHGEHIRIISARRATHEERRIYAQGA